MYESSPKAALFSGGTRVIAIAASTGGVETLEKIIPFFPANVPPIALVQHMPPGLTRSFATRLNLKYNISVKEAESGDILKQGQMLIAPGGKHMQIVNLQGNLAAKCFIGERLHGVIPSADILFESVANVVQKNAIGVILTGMGADGARGLLMMRQNGASTIGQDKHTCCVYGMPKVAMNFGAVEYELPLEQIANKILSLARR